jgi:hypothetical protein
MFDKLTFHSNMVIKIYCVGILLYVKIIMQQLILKEIKMVTTFIDCQLSVIVSFVKKKKKNQFFCNTCTIRYINFDNVATHN